MGLLRAVLHRLDRRSGWLRGGVHPRLHPLAMRSDVYSCDWCLRPSPSSGSVGGNWEVFHPATTDIVRVEHLCETCSKARKAAIEAARRVQLKAREGQTQ